MWSLTTLTALSCTIPVICAESFFNSELSSINGADTNGQLEVRIASQNPGYYGTNGWVERSPYTVPGFQLASNGWDKVGWRLTGDDESAIVWEYDNTTTGDAENSTWDAIDTTVNPADVSYTITFTAAFTNLTSDATTTTNSDIWDDGPFSPELPNAEVPVTIDQTCSSTQTINGTASDANGKLIISLSGTSFSSGTLGETFFVIPAKVVYPVTIILSADVGSVTTVISNIFPIKYAIGNGTNAPTLTVNYSLQSVFCPV